MARRRASGRGSSRAAKRARTAEEGETIVVARGRDKEEEKAQNTQGNDPDTGTTARRTNPRRIAGDRAATAARIAAAADAAPPPEVIHERAFARITAAERETWQGWTDIESEPAFFNFILGELGIRGATIQEVFAVDEASAACLPWVGDFSIALTCRAPADWQEPGRPHLSLPFCRGGGGRGARGLSRGVVVCQSDHLQCLCHPRHAQHRHELPRPPPRRRPRPLQGRHAAPAAGPARPPAQLRPLHPRAPQRLCPPPRHAHVRHGAAAGVVRRGGADTGRRPGQEARRRAGRRGRGRLSLYCICAHGRRCVGAQRDAGKGVTIGLLLRRLDLHGPRPHRHPHARLPTVRRPRRLQSARALPDRHARRRLRLRRGPCRRPPRRLHAGRALLGQEAGRQGRPAAACDGGGVRVVAGNAYCIYACKGIKSLSVLCCVLTSPFSFSSPFSSPLSSPFSFSHFYSFLLLSPLIVWKKLPNVRHKCARRCIKPLETAARQKKQLSRNLRRVRHQLHVGLLHYLPVVARVLPGITAHALAALAVQHPAVDDAHKPVPPVPKHLPDPELHALLDLLRVPPADHRLPLVQVAHHLHHYAGVRPVGRVVVVLIVATVAILVLVVIVVLVVLVSPLPVGMPVVARPLPPPRVQLLQLPLVLLVSHIERHQVPLDDPRVLAVPSRQPC